MAVQALPVAELQRVMRGPVLDPEHGAYEVGRASFNALIDRRPAVIARCAGIDDVVAAVGFAKRHGLPVSVRGGGHSVAGHCIGDDAVMIDLRLMHDVQVDPVRRRVVAGGGATWRDVDTPCAEHQLAVPGGTFDTTGVAGLTLTGGIGHLMGVHGLSLDNLVSAEVVLADGSVATASATGDPDLFWALRGGGGNFGVVTRFEFEVHPLPAVWGGVIVYGQPHLAEAVRLVRDVMAAAPDELALNLFLTSDVPGGGVAVTVCYAGEVAAAEEAVRPLREELPVLLDGLGLTSYLQIQVMVGDEPFGMRHYWKGQFLPELGDDLIDRVVAGFAERPDDPHDVVLIEFIHGKARRVPRGETAFGARGMPYNVSPMGLWHNAQWDDQHITWVRSMCDEISRGATLGGYLNYSTEEPAERIRAAYGDDIYNRLADLKARYDPDNLFRFNHNIPPAA